MSVDIRQSGKHPSKPVIKVNVIRAVTKDDGTEDIVEESILPLGLISEDGCTTEAVEELENDHQKALTLRFARRPATVTSKRYTRGRFKPQHNGEERGSAKNVENVAKEAEHIQSRIARILQKLGIDISEKIVTKEPRDVIPSKKYTPEKCEQQNEVVPNKKVNRFRKVSRKPVAVPKTRIIRQLWETYESSSRSTSADDDGKQGVAEESHFELSEEVIKNPFTDDENNYQSIVLREVIRRTVPVVTRNKCYRRTISVPSITKQTNGAKVEVGTKEEEEYEVCSRETISLKEEEESTTPHTTVTAPEEPSEEVRVKKHVHRIHIPRYKQKLEKVEKVPDNKTLTDGTDGTDGTEELTLNDTEFVRKHPKGVEGVHITRIHMQPDGSEYIIDESDTIFQLASTHGHEYEETDEKLGRNGIRVRSVIRRPIAGGESGNIRKIIRQLIADHIGKKNGETPTHLSNVDSSTTLESIPESDVVSSKEDVICPVSRSIIPSETEEGDIAIDMVVRETIRKPVQVATQRNAYRKANNKPDGAEIIDERANGSSTEDEHGSYIPAVIKMEEQESTPVDIEELFEELLNDMKVQNQIHQGYVIIPGNKNEDERPLESEEDLSLHDTDKISEEDVNLHDTDTIRMRTDITTSSVPEIEVLTPSVDVDMDYDIIMLPDDLTPSVKHSRPIEREHITQLSRKDDTAVEEVDESVTTFQLEFNHGEVCLAERNEVQNEVVTRRVVRRPITGTSKMSVIRRF